MRSVRVLVASWLLTGCTFSTGSHPPEPEDTTANPAVEPKPVADDEDASASAPKPVADADGDADAGSDTETDTKVAAASTSLTAKPKTTHEGDEPSADDGTEPTPDDGGAKGKGTLTAKDPGTADAPSKKPAAVTATLELPRPLHPTTNDECGKDAGVGEPLKAFSLPTPDGETVTNGTYRGRVLVVNFWGTWCKPCLKELPEFDQMYRRYRKHGMTLLAIATDEEGSGVSDFVDKRKLAAKVAIGGESYAGKYGSPKFPFTFVVDYKGIIRAAYRGYKPECTGQLEADIREQLEVRAEAKAKRKSRGKGKSKS